LRRRKIAIRSLMRLRRGRSSEFFFNIPKYFLPPHTNSSSQTPPNQTNWPLPLLAPRLTGVHRRGKSGGGRDFLLVEGKQSCLWWDDDVSVLEVGVFEHVFQYEESDVGGDGLDEGEVFWEGC
jgi:hypothetical protein